MLLGIRLLRKAVCPTFLRCDTALHHTCQFMFLPQCPPPRASAAPYPSVWRPCAGVNASQDLPTLAPVRPFQVCSPAVSSPQVNPRLPHTQITVRSLLLALHKARVRLDKQHQPSQVKHCTFGNKREIIFLSIPLQTHIENFCRNLGRSVKGCVLFYLQYCFQ